ncbi:MAG: FtsH protease activity modulator HflK [Chthoniobacterales bacterium]
MQITTSSGSSSASPFPPGFAFHPFRFLLGVIGCIGILITFFSLLFGFVSIPTNSVGIKLRFGAYHSTEGPGLAYAVPYVDEITIVPTQRLLKLEFGFTTPQASNGFQGDNNPEDTETMITGDLNTALVPWVVQYRIADPKQYLFGAREPEQTLRDLSESVMREVIGDRTVDEVLTIGRHDIETATLDRLAKLSSEYGLGLQIQQVQLATVRPPPAVQAAFNEVNQAQQEKQTAINQAWAIYNDAVPNARGSAKERQKQADAYAFTRVNGAKGDADKFTLLLTEYAKAPEITRRRLYFESMEKILPALDHKVVVDEGVKGILQTLPLLPAAPAPANGVQP